MSQARLPGPIALLDLATSASLCWCAVQTLFPPKCAFDTRFHAPLAKVIHPAVHTRLPIEQSQCHPGTEVSPLVTTTPHVC